MSEEVMSAEELKAMEEAMAAFLEEFRNPSRCDGANLRASVFPEKYNAVERNLKAGRFMTTIQSVPDPDIHIFLLHGGGFELEASMHCNVMMDLADAYIALPGGSGTLDEISEVIVLAALGKHGKPCILYNKAGFYEPLMALYCKMRDAGFMTDEAVNLIRMVSTPEELENIL